MTRRLTTQNATITTAAIQVQALTIGKKQVTQAVFRQLQEEQLITSEGALLGDPWGVVNYHPDKCADAPTHMHVVWQHGNELRRTTVQMPGVGWHSHPLADIYAHARIVYGTAHHPRNEPAPGDNLRLSKQTPNGWLMLAKAQLKYDGMAFEVDVPARLRNAWRSGAQAATDDDRRVLDMSLEMLGISPVEPVEQIADNLLAMIPTEKYRDIFVGLSGLPQLFIAV
ncbi:hypothetical protein [Streptomyces rubiginosohelvolus]